MADDNKAPTSGSQIAKSKTTNTIEKCTISIVIALFCANISLMCTSVVTDYWFTASVRRNSDNTFVGRVNGGLLFGRQARDDGQGEQIYAYDGWHAAGIIYPSYSVL